MKMTGLDIDNDVIIEIFCIITNGNLDVVDEAGWGAVVHQSKETMDKMVFIGFPAIVGAELTAETRASGAPKHMARMVSPPQ